MKTLLEKILMRIPYSVYVMMYTLPIYILVFLLYVVNR
jgi:hypothetical protein